MRRADPHYAYTAVIAVGILSFVVGDRLGLYDGGIVNLLAAIALALVIGLGAALIGRVINR